MNQIRLIKATINKYEDQPEIQADLKKVVKYCESFIRHSLKSVFSTSVEEEIEEITDSYDGDNDAERAFTAAVLAIKASLTGDTAATDKLKEIIGSLKHRPSLQKDLIAVIRLATSDIEPTLVEAIKANR